jgi:hypothetical protein
MLDCRCEVRAFGNNPTHWPERPVCALKAKRSEFMNGQSDSTVAVTNTLDNITALPALRVMFSELFSVSYMSGSSWQVRTERTNQPLKRWVGLRLNRV